MKPATSIGGTGKFNILITNGEDHHSARAWAEVVAKNLVYADPALGGQKAVDAYHLRRNLVEVLEPLFGLPRRPATDRTLELMAQTAKGTPWEIEFSSPHIQSLMRLEIERHLNTVYPERT